MGPHKIYLTTYAWQVTSTSGFVIFSFLSFYPYFEFNQNRRSLGLTHHKKKTISKNMYSYYAHSRVKNVYLVFLQHES